MNPSSGWRRVLAARSVAVACLTLAVIRLVGTDREGEVVDGRVTRDGEVEGVVAPREQQALCPRLAYTNS
jgi:hypothetical protein